MQPGHPSLGNIGTMEESCNHCEAAPAQVICGCDQSRLCATCISPHFLAAPRVTHTIKSIEVVDLCGECGSRNAVIVSCCGKQMRKWCEECGRNHRAECGEDCELPIEAQLGHDPYEFHNRQRFLLTLQSEVEKLRLDLLHKEQDIERFYNEVEARIKEFRERDRMHFERMKGITEHHFASILERIKMLRCSWPPSTSHIVDELLENQDTLRTEDIANALKLYSIDIDPVESIRKLEFAVEIHYENAGSPPEALYFFIPGSNVAAIYDVPKAHKRFVKGNFPLIFKQDASWCVLPNDSVFYCGGFDGAYSKEAMIISLIFKNGSMVLPMLHNRKWAGVAYNEGYVYVFGGCSGPWLKKCEKYSLKDKTWEALAEMNEGRAVSGPTYWRRKFLLCGYNSLKIEIFDIESGSFFSLSQVLPNTQDVLSFVQDEEAVFLQKDKMIKLNLESNAEMETANISNLNQTYTRVSPVKVGELFYYVDDRGRVWSIDVDAQLANVIEVLTL